MRQLIPLIILLFCFSCSGNKTTKDNLNPDAAFGNKLITADFLKYANSNEMNLLNEQVKKSFDIYDERNYKILHIDAEELADFNFDFFLPQLKQILGKRHFQLEVNRAGNYETSNEVFINGEKTQLYTNEEFEKGGFWDKASARFFKKLNELLKKQHCKESFFLLYNGNDLQAILLTGKQFTIITHRYKNEPVEIPYRP